jgi:hypothetical protein
MIKNLLILICVLFFLPAICWQAQAETAAPQFFSALPDVPLMEGLQEITDQTSAYDKPEGRIVDQLALIKNVSNEAIKRFYDQTLPQLGWYKTGELSYQRDKESMRLSIEENGNRKFLRVRLNPAL